MSEEPKSLADIISDIQPIELTAIHSIDWVAIGEAMATAFEPFMKAFNEVGANVIAWYDALPDDLKQQIVGDDRQANKTRAKQDVENKRRMQRGGKWKAF